MPLMLDHIRAEYARHLTGNANKRFSMDAALAHVITLAYNAGMEEGAGLDTARLMHHLHELGKVADQAALVLCTLEGEDADEADQIQQIIDGISTWAPSAMLAAKRP